MKNMKMYLTALGVLGLVGSALAFKAYSTTYCVAPVSAPGACSLIDADQVQQGGIRFYRQLNFTPQNCSQQTCDANDPIIRLEEE